jgi:hypothetical protein
MMRKNRKDLMWGCLPLHTRHPAKTLSPWLDGVFSG